MHLLAATPGSIRDGSEAVDLGQTPGDVVILSAADSELAVLAAAKARVAGPTVRLANLLQLGHPLSVDLYVETIIRHAKLVIVRLIGGRGYWSYGVEQIAAACRDTGALVAFLPGDDRPDPDLQSWSHLPAEAVQRLWSYLLYGGVENAEQALRYAAALIGAPIEGAAWVEPMPVPTAGLYPPGLEWSAWHARRSPDQPVIALVVYRAVVQAGNVAALDALQAAVAERGGVLLPLYVASLKDPVSVAMLTERLGQVRPAVILNATAFAVSTPEHLQSGPFAAADCPVIQVIFSGGTRADWESSPQGLSARDIAMNIALPEIDGRIIGRAVSFKAAAIHDADTQCPIVTYAPLPDRIAFIADLALHWARLRHKTAAERRIALVLANYPNRESRIGNGVGLDTPAAVIEILTALQQAGYRVSDPPADGAALMAGLTGRDPGFTGETLALPDYLAFFRDLPDSVQQAVTAHWGPPERDPFFRPGAVSCGGFALTIRSCGGVVIGVQPPRGYDLDPLTSYHDPLLVPPHGYIAFYAWLRQSFGADALVHVGKHGTLEWLPGKALALSESCFPDALLGPLPHLYPFIVNDPGEGSQAKRRTQAVIIDHLTPPLTRAGTYGPLRQLELLVDEYYEATAVDPRRLKLLRQEILALTRTTGLDADCGIAAQEDDESALKKLDNHLCELKELQIRDGLHIFGQAPQGALLTDLLVALARAPRGPAPEQASLLRALADDVGLGFDPLDCALAEPWLGPFPALLTQWRPDEAWRTAGDTVERLEDLARAWVEGIWLPPAGSAWPRTAPVMAWITTHLRPTVEGCGAAEMSGLLRGLAGRFVPPGPSGAPTRGRPDVLPTGRNFFSVDSRTVPTPTAWTLGWKAAQTLIDRHMQEHGDWPRHVALTAWGTSNMRTGGDDIAQALALMGVRPCWDNASRRVTGFEILPLGVLDRPRIDVTLRISGFFRDAFPALIDLFDSAVRAVAALEEEAADNPLAAAVQRDAATLVAQGYDARAAQRAAGFRVFGAQAGGYGAGLGMVIESGQWESAADLGRAYLDWGGHAYGDGAEGVAAQEHLARRLVETDLVIQMQDNQEHDLLDSDNYYQFEGGLAAAVQALRGEAPSIYHIDTSQTPKVRTLDEEIARIVRGRVVNPKWIAGVMRHGYKGAMEMAASVDYLFAFAATTGAVKSHHFDAVFDAYLDDDDVLAFLRDANPAALADMIATFRDALRRGLWVPRRNSVLALLEDLP